MLGEIRFRDLSIGGRFVRHEPPSSQCSSLSRHLAFALLLMQSIRESSTRRGSMELCSVGSVVLQQNGHHNHLCQVIPPITTARTDPLQPLSEAVWASCSPLLSNEVLSTRLPQAYQQRLDKLTRVK
jgi:hypothetical protein